MSAVLFQKTWIQMQTLQLQKQVTCTDQTAFQCHKCAFVGRSRLKACGVNFRVFIPKFDLSYMTSITHIHTQTRTPSRLLIWIYKYTCFTLKQPPIPRGRQKFSYVIFTIWYLDQYHFPCTAYW